MPASDLLQDTLTVTWPPEGASVETFVFKIPGVQDYARIGSRAFELRRAAAPRTGGDDWGLDPLTSSLYRGMALFELLLVRADTKDNWPFTEQNGKPVVDSSQWGPRAVRIVPGVTGRFDEAFNRFLDGGVGDGESAGQETVDGQPAGA